MLRRCRRVPRKRKLKVFRTPIGFHDAYVAAPSRKAALAAWGAGTDLFSAKIAEEVKDAGEGATAALAKPGKVVRIGRHGGKESPSRPGRPKSRKVKPAPSRAAVDIAEAALARLEEKQSVERGKLRNEEAKLAKRRHALEAKHAKAREAAAAKRDAAEARYRKAMADRG